MPFQVNGMPVSVLHAVVERHAEGHRLLHLRCTHDLVSISGRALEQREEATRPVDAELVGHALDLRLAVHAVSGERHAGVRLHGHDLVSISGVIRH